MIIIPNDEDKILEMKLRTNMYASDRQKLIAEYRQHIENRYLADLAISRRNEAAPDAAALREALGLVVQAWDIGQEMGNTIERVRALLRSEPRGEPTK